MEDELPHEIADDIKLRIVIAVTEPFEEDAVAGPVERVVDWMSTLDVLQFLPESIGPVTQHFKPGCAGGNPLGGGCGFPPFLGPSCQQQSEPFTGLCRDMKRQAV